MKEVDILHFPMSVQEAFWHFEGRVKSEGLISDLELRYLLALASDARLVKEPIVEIGTHIGGTTKALATTFPNRLVYTVDCVKTPSLLSVHQQAETPSWENVCVLARDLPNVVYINGDTRSELFKLPYCGFAFIDGDHSYNAVAVDSYNARAAGARCIVFHDARSDARLHWLEVHEYLQCMEAVLNIVLIKDTNLAVSNL